MALELDNWFRKFKFATVNFVIKSLKFLYMSFCSSVRRPLKRVCVLISATVYLSLIAYALKYPVYALSIVLKVWNKIFKTSSRLIESGYLPGSLNLGLYPGECRARVGGYL